MSKLSTRVTTILSTEPRATSFCVSKTSPPSNSLLIRFTCVAVVGEFILGVEQTLVLHRRCLLFLEMTLLLRRCVSENATSGERDVKRGARQISCQAFWERKINRWGKQRRDESVA